MSVVAYASSTLASLPRPDTDVWDDRLDRLDRIADHLLAAKVLASELKDPETDYLLDIPMLHVKQQISAGAKASF